MVYWVKEDRPCIDCDEPTARRVGRQKRPRCEACSLVASADSIRQLASKRGPYYDRWRTNLLASMEDRE